MHEATPETVIFGLLAEFDKPERLIAGVKQAQAAGFTGLDAYSPFPVEGLADMLGFRDHRVPWLTFFGGLSGAVVGFGMQAYTNLDFPIAIGGRPLVATPAFMLITFELAVLFAVLFSIAGMLALNHLPRLHHPVFDVETFHLASSDRFFLIIFADDAKFNRDDTRQFLEGLAPVRVDIVEHAQGPE
jgi:hypothetical protein